MRTAHKTWSEELCWAFMTYDELYTASMLCLELTQTVKVYLEDEKVMNYGENYLK